MSMASSSACSQKPVAPNCCCRVVQSWLVDRTGVLLSSQSALPLQFHVREGSSQDGAVQLQLKPLLEQVCAVCVCFSKGLCLWCATGVCEYCVCACSVCVCFSKGLCLWCATGVCVCCVCVHVCMHACVCCVYMCVHARACVCVHVSIRTATCTS
jgi:hypothetical protein